jgi:hypothetical protein
LIRDFESEHCARKKEMAARWAAAKRDAAGPERSSGAAKD